MKFPPSDSPGMDATGIASLGFVVFLASTALLPAVDYTWTGTTDNDWETVTNWSPNGTPTSGAHRIQIGTGSNGNTYEKRAIFSADQGEVILTGGTADRSLVLGNGGTGHFEITGGSLISRSKSPDIMANSLGNAYFYVTGGSFSKVTGTDISGTFALNYASGTSYLEIAGTGRFEVTTLDFQNAGGGTAGTMGTIQLDSGGTLAVQNFISTQATVMGTRTVNLNGGTIESLGDSTWADLNNVSWNLLSTSTFKIGNSVTLAEALSGAGGLNKTGVGTLRLSGANSYDGVTTISEGPLVVAHNNALGTTGNGTNVSSGARIVLANGVTVTGEALNLQGLGDNQGALQVGGNATATWAGDITVVGTGETRIGGSSNGHLIINGNINATASTMGLGIRMAGTDLTTGTTFDNTAVTLAGTFTGPKIRLIQGVLRLGASERIQDSAGIVLGHDTVSGLRQRFDLNGFNETVAYVEVELSNSSQSNEITNSSATGSVLTLDSSGANRTFKGIVTGNLGIEKLGSNSVTFSGVNTYTGETQVKEGTFNIADGGALNGGGSVTVASGATFNLSSLGTLAFNIGDNGVNNTVSGAGSVNLQGIIHFNLTTAAIEEGNAWDLEDVSGSVNWTGATVTSTDGDFTNDGEIWTLIKDGRHWSFDQSTGILSLVTIPEPGPLHLLMIGGSACATLRRRKHIVA